MAKRLTIAEIRKRHTIREAKKLRRQSEISRIEFKIKLLELKAKKLKRRKK